MPREIGFPGDGRIVGVPVSIILLCVVAIVGVHMLDHMRLGTYTRAIGNSRQSARATNLPIGRVLIAIYALSGRVAGIAGLGLPARVGGLQPGIGVEFTVVAAVVLGGTKLTGGSGSVAGAVIGAVVLVLIDNGLDLLNASPFICDVVRGSVLLAAALIDRYSAVRQKAALEAKRAARIEARDRAAHL